MIICYPIIDGKKTEKHFYENWDETPIDAFVKWQAIAVKLEKIENKVAESRAKVIEFLELAKVAKFNGNAKEETKHSATARYYNAELSEIVKEQRSLIIDGIACFCNIPISVLAAMPSDEHLQTDSDNHLNAYEARLFALAVTPLPTDTKTSFYFQTETDEDIQELEYQYRSLGLMRFFTKGRKLRKKLKRAKVGSYAIQDIWLQSTATNKEFIDLANAIIEQMKEGDFSGLVYLIAMLTVEGGAESEALDRIKNETNAKAYLEKYRIEFRNIYKKREEIFTKSKKALTIGTVMRIKNFFLHS